MGEGERREERRGEGEKKETVIGSVRNYLERRSVAHLTGQIQEEECDDDYEERDCPNLEKSPENESESTPSHHIPGSKSDPIEQMRDTQVISDHIERVQSGISDTVFDISQNDRPIFCHPIVTCKCTDFTIFCASFDPFLDEITTAAVLLRRPSLWIVTERQVDELVLDLSR